MYYSDSVNETGQEEMPEMPDIEVHNVLLNGLNLSRILT